ncbi:rhodanese domain protein [gamma proteobacterium HTCC5015]|nr:rhodanese domain protein [gamma proteobacterium HTCC5015]
MKTITATELSQYLQDNQPVLLDVREPSEHAICTIPGSTLMPMSTIVQRIDELDKQAEIICICHHGMRSMQVAQHLSQHGFENVVNLTGGVDAWALTVNHSMPRY